MLKYMNAAVAGVSVPQALIDRMKKANKAARKEAESNGEDEKAAKKAGRRAESAEGLKIAVELVEQVREIEGVAGVHIQAIEWERKVRDVVEGAGLLPRPDVSDLG
jgi:methylenetetrahydrofolate reductase (NADPH)